MLGTGLQQSLELLLSEWRGSKTFLSALSRYRGEDSGFGTYLSEWQRQCVGLFESLSVSSIQVRGIDSYEQADIGAHLSTVKAENGVEIRMKEREGTFDVEEVDDGDKSIRAYRKGTRAFLPPGQVETIRVQLKKVRVALNDEPAGSDKTD